MAKMKKMLTTILLGFVMCISLCLGVALSTPKMASDTTAQAATTYTTKDVAMMAYIDNAYQPNGNFYLYITLSELDTTTQAEGVGVDTSKGDMPTILRNFDFYNKVKINGYTLAELGCTGVWENAFDVNSGGGAPLYKLRFHMHADPTTWNKAIDDGKVVFGVGSNVTISEGALVPGYNYLTGDHTATVYRAGCDFVSSASGVAYSIMSVGKTEVESLQYITGWDSNYNNAYLGVSLKGDDYAGNGTPQERHPDYYSSVFTTNHFTNMITVDGQTGKAESYGLFNHNEKGKGYLSFVFRANEADSESITIPAGTLFPSYAMRNLFEPNGNPVYIFYETQTDVTFYKQADGTWAKPYVEKETSVSSAYVDSDGGTSFTVLFLSNHDYATELDNYGGTAVKVKEFLARSNFYTHVLIDGVALGSTGEAYVNVWGNKGSIAFRTSQGVNATKITVLAGCEIPSYAELLSGERIKYVTTEDITFVKNANGEWEKYIPAGDMDVSVTQVQFGRSTNVININLSDNDYPAPDGNNSATYNIGVDPAKILSLNLLDNIIIDGYTLRARYNNYSNALTNPWLWINRFVGHNFAIRVANEGGAALTPNKVVIRAGTQFPSKAYIDNGTELFYVTTEEVTYLRVSNDVETSWERQAKLTFKADGETISEIPYTKTFGLEGEIPAVPEKAGYKGIWESYTLTGGDVVVNAVYTAHSFTEIPTSLLKMEYEEAFLIVYLTNHDYAGIGGTKSVRDKVPNLHFFDYVEVDGKIASKNPSSVDKDAFLNVWNRTGSFAIYLPDGVAAPAQKVVLKKGCQIPSNAYRLDANNLTCYVLEEDVTFLYENGAWVKQSDGGDAGNSGSALMPKYENNYILSDLYQTGHEASAELEKGYLYVDKTTDGKVYGYNTSSSFSITFDFSMNLGSNDVSAQGNYTVFDISMATRGWNSSHGFGWSLYLYRPGNANKCVEFHCSPSENAGEAGSLGAYDWVGNFEKGVIYRVTLGYRLIDEATGTVETYVNINGQETLQTFVLGTSYMQYEYMVDSISFMTNSAITNGVLITDPGFNPNADGRHTITLQDGDTVLAQEKAWNYTLPELDAYKYGKEGQVFIGWTNNTSTIEKLYPAGSTVELTKDETYYPVWMYLNMRDGAAVRVSGTGGLRFLVDVDGAAYQFGVNKSLIKGAGTLLVPSNYLDNGLAFVHESFPAGYYVDIPTAQWNNQTGDVWTYVAALTNISPAQYTRSMSARGYLKIAYSDGTEGYVYTAYSKDLHARSIYQVATMAYNKNERPDMVINYVNSVADITLNNGFTVDKNGVGNYAVSYEKTDLAFTVTFDKAVKAVVINGERILAGYSAEIVIDGSVYNVDGYKLSTNGLTLSFTLETGDMTAYYQSLVNYYAKGGDYTEEHQKAVDSILQAWGGNYSDAAQNAAYAAQLERIKTTTEQRNDVGTIALATPVISYGEALGYAVTWTAVANADYYYVTDDNDYRNGVYVFATEDLVYKPEVVGKHNVTVTAYSYYEEFNASATSAPFETVEVKPVFSYKAMAEGLYKFDKDQMAKLGLSTDDDYYTHETTKTGSLGIGTEKVTYYFAYYNKEHGWSTKEANATDWTSPAELPDHAANLKAMGNNILLLSENTSASLKANSVWETSRTKYVMDTAWSLGMKVIVCDDVLYKASKDSSSESATKSTVNGRKAMIEKYVTHPAFYGFSLEDEPEMDEIDNVSWMVKALKTVCAEFGYSKANGNEPFFLACLYQKNVGFTSGISGNYNNYLSNWVSETGLDYLYIDLYTGHAMGDSTNRYTSTYSAVYSDSLGVMSGDVKFHQVITAHTQNKGSEGVLTEQDMYMSMLYAAAHNVAGYSWFCYFPIVEELAGSMVGFDGMGYGNGIGNKAGDNYSYYDAAAKAGYQFEIIQGLLNGYQLLSRKVQSNLLTTTLTNGTNTITVYVNADTQSLSATPTANAQGSKCYLFGHGIDGYYQMVSGRTTLQPGQAIVCIA